MTREQKNKESRGGKEEWSCPFSPSLSHVLRWSCLLYQERGSWRRRGRGQSGCHWLCKEWMRWLDRSGMDFCSFSPTSRSRFRLSPCYYVHHDFFFSSFSPSHKPHSLRMSASLSRRSIRRLFLLTFRAHPHSLSPSIVIRMREVVNDNQEFFPRSFFPSPAPATTRITAVGASSARPPSLP